jgi:hypothetical protein
MFMPRITLLTFGAHVLAAWLILGLVPAHATVVVGPCVQGVTTTNAYVTAECDSTAVLTVSYGTTTSYGATATTAFTKSTGNGSYVVHRIKLTGLTPNTLYNYQLSGQGITPTNYAFRTLLNPGTSYRFGWDADYRNGTDVHSAIASRILNLDKPLFLLEGGDTCADGSYAGWHNEFFIPNERELEKWLPVYPTTGNHETWSTLTQAYYQSPDSSGSTGYYSFDSGDVHFIMGNYMDPAGFGVGTAQYNWIQQDVQASIKPWKIFGDHAPAYCSGGDGPNTTWQTVSANLLVPNGVKVFLAGHSHFYQHNLVSGLHHLIVGACGAPLYTPTTASYTVKSVQDNCYLIADVSATNLHMVIYNTNGLVLDTVDLVKLAAPTGLVAIPGNGQVTLGWNPVVGATSYTALYGTTAGGPYPTKRTVTTPATTVTGLANGTPCYFVVTASDANGPSAISSQASTIPNPPPAISSFGTLSNGSFVMGGTGAANQTYVLLTASNLALPIVWTPLATNMADVNGAFGFADLQATNYQQRFYRIRTP